jgi:hypothetical protein
MTVSCESFLTFNITGMPKFTGGCGFDGLRLNFTDTTIPGDKCGEFTVVRNFTVTQDGCNKKYWAVQNIKVIDQVAPVFETFPQDATVGFLEPVS